MHTPRSIVTGVAWHALVGDHDAQGDPHAIAFRARVGDPRGSLRLRGFRFLRLNTQEARPVGLRAAQLEWLRSEMGKAAALEERVIVFQHNYPYQIWENYCGSGIEVWREIIQARSVHAIFCGHTHYWQVANDGRNIFIATRSIGDPEGGPPGYTLVFLCGEDLSVAHRTVEDRSPLVLITHPRDTLLCTGPEHIVCGDTILRSRIWSAQSVKEVRARVDEGESFLLKDIGPQDWISPLPASRLLKGVHRLNVRAVDNTGGVGEQSIGFAVDSTGRYTAVPCVHPVVTATRFC